MHITRHITLDTQTLSPHTLYLFFSKKTTTLHRTWGSLLTPKGGVGANIVVVGGHEGVLVWFFNRSALAVRFCARVELGIGICSIVRIVQSKAKRHQRKFYSVPGQQESLSENEDL